MKLSKLMLLGLSAVFANAQGTGLNHLLDVNSKCSSTSSVLPGIEVGECRLDVSKMAPGFELHLQDGRTRFFFESFYSIKMNVNDNSGLPIRFVVWEDEKEYNAIQAIVQTAYATRAPLSIVFDNPKKSVYNLDEYYITTTRKREKTCYLKDNIIYCPIKSIQLGAI